MRLFVTGGTGFIGSNIAHVLAEMGNEVIVPFRSAPDEAVLDFLADVNERVVLVPGDVEDAERISSLVQMHQVDGIVHAAAVTPLPKIELAKPRRVLQINFMGTVHVLEAARMNKVKRVVYISSNAVYGDTTHRLITEDTTPDPRSLYGIAKVASEAVCRRYQTLYGLEVVSGRVCSTYGPMERPTQSRQGMSAVYMLAQAALKGEKCRVRGLSVARNWTHVKDVASAVVALLEKDRPSHGAYNLSYGKLYTLEDVLEVFEALEPSFRYEVIAQQEPAHVAYDETEQRGPMDVTRLREDIGYEPRYDLESGIRAYMDWLQSQGQ